MDRVGGERSRARWWVGGRRGAAARPGEWDSARLRLPFCPSRRGSWKTSGEDGSPSLCSLPPRAGGSAPGWGGGGPDACDWPLPHLGRQAPPPPSCWEQLLLSELGRRAWALEPALGWCWRRLEAALISASPARTRQSPRESARPSTDLRCFPNRKRELFALRYGDRAGDQTDELGARRPGAVLWEASASLGSEGHGARATIPA